MDFLPTIASVAGKQLISKTTAALIGRRKARKIKRLISDYKKKAFGVDFPPAGLSPRFDNSHVCDELISTCYLGTKSKAESVSLFLYGTANPPSNNRCTAAERLVERFYDEVCEILGETSKPDAAAIQSSISRVTAETRNLRQQELQHHQALMDRLDELAPTDAGLASANALVKGLEEGKISFGRFEATASEESYESSPGKFLKTYIGFCKGRNPEVEPDFISGLPIDAAVSLASAAFSAGEHDSAASILDATEGGADYAFAARQAGRRAASLGRLSEEGVPASSPFMPFVLSLNAESCMLKGAYPLAHKFYNLCNGTMNPVARAHSEIAKMAHSLTYEPETITEPDAFDYAVKYPDWGDKRLQETFCSMLDGCLMTLKSESLQRVFPKIPEKVRLHLPDASFELDLDRVSDAESIKALCDEALSHDAYMRFCRAAEKLASIDQSARPWAGQRARESDMLDKCDIFSFLFYVNQICPETTAAEFESQAERFKNEPRFHLEAYKRYKGSDGTSAKAHAEKALSLMRESNVLPCIEYCDTWISYLLDNERPSEILDLLEPYLEVIPAHAFEKIIATMNRPIEEGDLAFELFERLGKSGNADPKILVDLAWFYGAIAGSDTKALGFASESFDEAPSKPAAALAMSSRLALHMDIPEEMEDYARMQDDTQLDMLLSEAKRKSGDLEEADLFLKRAILRNDEMSARALCAFAAEHLGHLSRLAPPDKVAPDTVVVISDVNGDSSDVIAFHGNAKVLKAEGESAAGAANYSCASPEYIAFAGSEKGDTATYEGRDWTVEDIEVVNAHLAHEGLKEMAKDPSTKLITSEEGNPYEAIEQIVSILRENATDDSVYQNGLEAGPGVTVYFGLESGSRLYSKNPLEFVLSVISSDGLPFRRVETGLSEPVGDRKEFLLSYNAIVLLAGAAKRGVDLSPLSGHCFVTTPTKNRLNDDILELSKALDSAGKLVLVDDKPRLFKYDKEAKRDARAIHAELSATLGKIPAIDPALNSSSLDEMKNLDQNTIVDMSTAASRNMFFVTEDCLQANIAQICEDGPSRCSIYTLLIACQAGGPNIGKLAACYKDWGATPVIDLNIAAIIDNYIARFFENKESDNSTGFQSPTDGEADRLAT